MGGQKSSQLSHQNQKEESCWERVLEKWQEELRRACARLEVVRRTCLSSWLSSSHNVQGFPQKWL